MLFWPGWTPMGASLMRLSGETLMSGGREITLLGRASHSLRPNSVECRMLACDTRHRECGALCD